MALGETVAGLDDDGSIGDRGGGEVGLARPG